MGLINLIKGCNDLVGGKWCAPRAATRGTKGAETPPPLARPKLRIKIRCLNF